MKIVSSVVNDQLNQVHVRLKMRSLKIHCKNCKGLGRIDHPTEITCPFCNGKGNKDIEYEMEGVSPKP